MKSGLLADFSQASDEELVRRVCSGNRELFTYLVRRYERIVYRIVHGILDNPADCEEVLQESFLQVLQHIETFRGEAQFRTWLTRIAINEARRRLRKYRAKLHDSIDEVPNDMMAFRARELRDWYPNPEEKLATEELGRLLESALCSLPRIYREVFLLRDIEHLSNKETARTLGISIAATKTRLLRARLMMREYLAPHYQAAVSLSIARPIHTRPQVSVIRCEDVLRELSNYIDGEVSAALRQQIEEHIRHCHDCKVLVSTTRTTLSLIANNRVLELPPWVSERLMAHLASAGSQSALSLKRLR